MSFSTVIGFVFCMPRHLILCVHRLQNLSIDNMAVVTDLQSTMRSSVNARPHTRPLNCLQRGGAEC